MSVAQTREALRNAREAAGLTQQEAGRIVGVSRQTIAAWESASPPPAARYVLFLARSRPAARFALLDAIGIPPGQIAADQDPELNAIVARLRDLRQSSHWPDARNALDAFLNTMLGA